MSKRVLLSVFIFVLIWFAPYWLYLPAILLSLAFLPFYIEGVVLSLLADTLYGSGEQSFFLFNYPLAILATVLLVAAPIVQRRLRFNA